MKTDKAIRKIRPEWVDEMEKSFRWRTMEDKILNIEDMKTSHIFNSMKMLFNHLVVKRNGRPVWFKNLYGKHERDSENNPKEVCKNILFFIWFIEERGDIPEKYKAPYRQIADQIFKREIVEEIRSITWSDLL